MAYLELMMSEYRMSLNAVWRVLPVIVGFALIEAREERLTGDCLGFVSRTGIIARQKERRRLEAAHRVIETPIETPVPPAS